MSITDQHQLRCGNDIPYRGPTEHNIGSVPPGSHCSSSWGRTMSRLCLQGSRAAQSLGPPVPVKLWESPMKVSLYLPNAVHFLKFYWKFYYYKISIES